MNRDINGAAEAETREAETREAGQALLEVFRRFKRVMKRPAAGHARTGEMAVMAAVAFHHVEKEEGIRISDIAANLKIAPPTVTQFINGLEKTGWVERRMDPNDRRAVLVYLTEEGRRCHARFEADMLALFQGLADHIGDEDAFQLARILDKSFGYLEEAARKHHEQHHQHEIARRHPEQDQHREIARRHSEQPTNPEGNHKD